MSNTEHEAKLRQVTENLQRLAGSLIQQHPEFPRESFARAFLSVAVGMLLVEVGDKGTADYLARLVADIRAGGQVVN